jgi:Icc-related predicted phosphoesterase
MVRVAQSVLTLIPSYPGTATTKAIAEEAGMTRHDVVEAIGRLSRRGLVVHARRGRYQRTRDGDRVAQAQTEIKPGPPRPGIDAAGVPAKRPLRSDHVRGRGTLLDRAWSALRQLRKATVPELLELAADDERYAETSLSKYLRRLAAHGVVVALSRRVRGMAPTSNGFVQWTLIRDLGPKAPLWRGSTRELVDRNSGLTILLPEGEP